MTSSSRRSLLLAAFDAASAVLGDLIVFERDEPESPQALREWASRHGRSLTENPISPDHGIVLRVETCHRPPRHIEVFTVLERRGEP